MGQGGGREPCRHGAGQRLGGPIAAPLGFTDRRADARMQGARARGGMRGLQYRERRHRFGASVWSRAQICREEVVCRGKARIVARQTGGCVRLEHLEHRK